MTDVPGARDRGADRGLEQPQELVVDPRHATGLASIWRPHRVANIRWCSHSPA